MPDYIEAIRIFTCKKCGGKMVLTQSGAFTCSASLTCGKLLPPPTPKIARLERIARNLPLAESGDGKTFTEVKSKKKYKKCSSRKKGMSLRFATNYGIRYLLPVVD